MDRDENSHHVFRVGGNGRQVPQLYAPLFFTREIVIINGVHAGVPPVFGVNCGGETGEFITTNNFIIIWYDDLNLQGSGLLTYRTHRT